MNIFTKQAATTDSDLLIPVLSTQVEQLARKEDLFKLVAADFKGEKGEVQLVYQNGQRIFLLGLGESPDFTTMVRTFRSFAHKWRKKLRKDLTVQLTNQKKKVQLSWSDAAANGLTLATYDIGIYKTSEKEKHPFLAKDASLTFLVAPEYAEAVKMTSEKGRMTADTQMEVMRLVNSPSNKKIPADLANWAIASGKKYGYSVKVFDKDAIVKTGLHALLAVNRGSEEPARFIIMEHKPSGKNLKMVALVGKGVTFDTGGLSIKPSGNMHYMKSDMGGAGAVFGTMEMVAKLNLPIHLVGIVPATDNSVDANAIKPSDVIESYSGKTIEIIDTDAEGRLILADGLAYAVKHYQPEILIDLATLTGSTVRTFGYHAGALFSNNKKLAKGLCKAGDATGERLWQLPLWDVYKEDISSDVADVRNFSGKPLAGAISAAKFLEVFTNEHPKWAHLDIAGVAFSDAEFSTQKSSTAFGIRLLTEYLTTIA